MKRARREILRLEDILNYLAEECDEEAPEIELIKQILEQLDGGYPVEPGEEFLTSGFCLILDDKMDE